MKYPLFWPSYDGRAIRREMKKLFPSNMSNRWIGQGKIVDEFEKEFGKEFGYNYCVSVNSGTSALDLAYHLAGIGEGDEVITPVLTCTATNIPLLHRKAKIVFADVSENLTVSYEDIKKKINKNTKAIVVVSLGGVRVDREIFHLARKHNIPVIEDAAQCVGLGNDLADYVCYSFQAIKHFTTGDGGMLVVRNEDDYKRAKKLRWFGIDREAKIKADWQPYKKRQMTMDIEEPGYKYHMNDIQAAIGLTSLKKSLKWLIHRAEIASQYEANINCKVITGGTNWLCGILVDNRDEVAEHLKKNGIETNMAHLRNDIFQAFGGERLDLPNMNRLEDKYLYIPINTMISLKDAKFITDKVNEVIK